MGQDVITEQFNIQRGVHEQKEKEERESQRKAWELLDFRNVMVSAKEEPEAVKKELEKIKKELRQLVETDEDAEGLMTFLENHPARKQLSYRPGPEEQQGEIESPFKKLVAIQEQFGKEELKNLWKNENAGAIMMALGIDNLEEGGGKTMIQLQEKQVTVTDAVTLYDQMIKKYERQRFAKIKEFFSYGNIIGGKDHESAEVAKEVFEMTKQAIQNGQSLQVLEEVIKTEVGPEEIITQEKLKNIKEKIDPTQGFLGIKEEKAVLKALELAIYSKQGIENWTEGLKKEEQAWKETEEDQKRREVIKKSIKKTIEDVQDIRKESGQDERILLMKIVHTTKVAHEAYIEVMNERNEDYKALPEYYTQKDQGRVQEMRQLLKYSTSPEWEKVQQLTEGIVENLDHYIQALPTIPEEVKEAYAQEEGAVIMSNTAAMVQRGIAHYLMVKEKEHRQEFKEKDQIGGILESYQTEVDIKEIGDQITNLMAELYEIDIPLYEKLLEEFDDIQDQKKAIEVFFGRDGDLAHAGRMAQKRTRTKERKNIERDILRLEKEIQYLGQVERTEGTEKIEKLKRKKEELKDIEVHYLIFNRPMNYGWPEEQLKQFFKEQKVFKEEQGVDYIGFDTGFYGSIPDKFLELAGYEEEERNERIKLLSSSFDEERRANFLNENVEDAIIHQIEERPKLVESAEGYTYDQEGEITLIERPKSAEEQILASFLNQVIRRHFYVREKEKEKTPS